MKKLLFISMIGALTLSTGAFAKRQASLSSSSEPKLSGNSCKDGGQVVSCSKCGLKAGTKPGFSLTCGGPLE